MAQVFLYETTGTRDDASTVPVRLTGGQGYNHPTAPGYYEGRIRAASDGSIGMALQRTVFDGGRFGAGSLAYGVIEAANPEGALDDWLDLGFGLDATLKLGDDEGPYSAFTTILKAKASQIVISDNALSFGWQSRTAELDLPACPATFAGTNSGTTGLEGLPDDIQGANKPWAMGKLSGISPILLNSSTRILGWNFDIDGDRLPTFSVDAVDYAGAAWTLYDTAPGSTDGDYPDAATLQTALGGFSVTQGFYITCLAESLVVMGGSSSLNSSITFDVTIEATAEERWAGNLWKACLLRAGVPEDDIDQDALDALNDAAPFEAYYYAQGENFIEIADRLAESVAACYVPDRLGLYRIYQMTAPGGDPVASFIRLELGAVAGLNDGDLMRISPISGSEWAPVKQVRVAYARNWTPLSANEVADSVSVEDQAFLTAEWRYTAPAISTAVTAKYGNAITQDFETYLVNQADAEAIRDVLLAIFGAQRREYQATVSYSPVFAELLDLGAVVRVTHPKFGMAAGKLAAIHGIRLSDRTQEAQLKLWL